MPEKQTCRNSKQMHGGKSSEDVDKLLVWQGDIISKHGLDIPLVNNSSEGLHATDVRKLFTVTWLSGD